MKTTDLIDSMTFTHRPQNGISVGFAVIAGVAYMAVGFVREGDFFNRKLARRILAQRIASSMERDVKMVTVIENVNEKVDARAVVREFRKTFKPDPNCNDDTFSNLLCDSYGTREIVGRAPMSRDNSLAKINKMFTDAVQAASVACVS